MERLGAPADIAAAAVEAEPEPAVAPAPRGVSPRIRGLEVASIITLAVGGVILPVIGVAAGVLLAWASSLWSRADKLVVTALPTAFALTPLLVVAARLGGWLPGPGRVSAVAPEFALLPDPMELLWSTGVLGPLLGGVLAALYLAIQAGRRARSG